MKYAILPLLLCQLSLAVCTMAQDAAPATAYDTLRAKAAAQKADLITFAYGTSDWDKKGGDIKTRTVTDKAWLAGLPKGILSVCVEIPDRGSTQIPQSTLDELRRLGRPIPGQPDDSDPSDDAEQAPAPDAPATPEQAATPDQPETPAVPEVGNPPDASDDSAPADSNAAGGFKVGLTWNFPALVYQDSEGQLIGILEGVDLQKTDAKALAAQVAAWHTARVARDAKLAEAEKATGPAKARLLGQALDALPYKSARRLRSIVVALRDADPKNETGYVTKYTYVPLSFTKEMLLCVAAKKHEEGLAIIAKHRANPLLTPEQKQVVEVQPYVLCRFWKGHEAEAEAALKTAMAMDPTSDVGIGCKGILQHLAGTREYVEQSKAIIAAEKAGDAQAYHKLAQQTVASTFHLPYRASLRGIAIPEFDRPAGSLLSKQGMLSFSGPVNSNAGYKLVPLRPLVLRDDEPGLCYLLASSKPWVQVDLLKTAAITGIVVVNRLDVTKEKAYQVPLVVSVSSDGKEWKEIYRSETVQDCWEVTPPAGLQARYVRVGRSDEPRQTFMLANILVYGNP